MQLIPLFPMDLLRHALFRSSSSAAAALLPLFGCSSEFLASSAAAATTRVGRSLSIIPCVARAPSL
ncbi:hypothetical protein AHAS_Ahas15G0148200 [Arachis hypogaea]